MEFTKHIGSKELWFDVAGAVAALEDQLAFIHLVTMKFDGRVVKADSLGKGKKKTLQFKVQFPSFQDCANAEAHCNDKLDENGLVTAAYRGALDRADPRRAMARRLRAQADSTYAKSVA